MKVGPIIKKYLEERNMTQGELASRSGISPQFMGDILKGSRIPSARVAKSILFSLNPSASDKASCIECWIDSVMGEWKDLAQERNSLKEAIIDAAEKYVEDVDLRLHDQFDSFNDLYVAVNAYGAEK